GALTPLVGVSANQWRALSMRAAEPNGYYLPEWELAVNASAQGRVDTDALGAWHDASSLIGLMPVISMWRAYRIPLPALVSADPYGTLCTPLLDCDMAEEAVTGILQQARRAGAHALIFRATSLDGAAMKAFTEVLHRGGMQRSEEHTSELQSPYDLVCRLLLEKKKKKKHQQTLNYNTD